MKTADIKRKNGYYKVFHNNEWRIAYWYIEGQCWFLVGVEKTFNDSEMDIIIETPITFEQTQPVPSKEVQENQTYGEFMRSNPEISTPSTTDTQDGKLNETFHNYGYPTDGGILGTEVSVKIDNQSNEETPSTTDIEKEAMELYPIKYEHSIGQRLINEEHKFKQQAHIKAYQMHRNDGLDQLIEWMEWESHRRWNESHELPDFTEILTKANEIKASLK